MSEDLSKNPKFNMCPEPDCTEWFYSKADLEAHIKMDHKGET
jgi:hypothetical protein